MAKPIWTPSQERIDGANMNRFVRFVRERTGNVDIQRYAPLYEFSIRQPDAFWPLVWDFCGIRASGEFEPVLENPEQMPGACFYPNVKLNFAQNLLRFRDDKPAIVFRNEWGQKREYTYAQLHAEVARVAHALSHCGVVAGDRVAGFLPNMPETVIAMLATASLGATWSSCSPDFGINGVVDRFGQIEPKVLFCADAYPYGGKTFQCLDKVRGVLEKIGSIATLVVVPYSGEPLHLSGLRNAVAWPDFAGAGDHALEFVPTAVQPSPVHPVFLRHHRRTQVHRARRRRHAAAAPQGAGAALRYQARATASSISPPAAG